MTHMANHARVVDNLEVMASLVHTNNVSTNVTQSNDSRPCSPTSSTNYRLWLGLCQKYLKCVHGTM